MLIRVLLFCVALTILVRLREARAEESALPADEVVNFILGIEGIEEYEKADTSYQSEVRTVAQEALQDGQTEKPDSDQYGNLTERSADATREGEMESAKPPREKDVSEGLGVLEPKPEELEPQEKVPTTKELEVQRRFFGPLPARNLHPLYLPFFNFRADVAGTLERGQSSFSINIEGANTIIKEIEGGAIVDLDLENWLYSFEYAMGLERGEIKLYLPLVVNSHGIMDNIIDRWHRLWGLPRGKRPLYPADDFRFYVRTRAGDIFNFPSDEFVLGDASLSWKGILAKGKKKNRYLSYRVAVKVPTGDEHNGTGSGGTDLGVGLLWQNTHGHLTYYANANYVWIGEGHLSGLAKDNFFSWMLAAEYSLRPSVTLSCQVNFSESPFVTGSPDADKDSYELWIGFHRLVSDGFIFSGGFSEDIKPGTAPDFGIIANLKWLLKK